MEDLTFLDDEEPSAFCIALGRSNCLKVFKVLNTLLLGQNQIQFEVAIALRGLGVNVDWW